MASDSCRTTLRVFVPALLVLTFLAPLHAQSDNCSTATPISGNGTFTFNLATATTSPEGQDAQNCIGGGTTGFANDVWYCWTAPCTGLVDIKTCGLTAVDTKIAFYVGCSCPTPPPSQPPLCCNDDGGPGCSPQSFINCEVQCGNKYLIRIGAKPGTAPGPGSFTIQCNGQDCQCDACCGKRPNFLPSGSAACTTLDTGGTDVLEIFNITAQPLPNWSNWFATAFVTSGAQNWTKANLGSVFGLTLDNLGNIYLAHTTIYGDQFGFSNDALGALGGGNPLAAGAIYKIDTNTGVPALFAKLPNAPIAGCPGGNHPCGPSPDGCFPGLGNLNFSCAHNMIYVSNFEDGRIYRLDTAGNILSTWYHAAGTASVGLPPIDPNGFPPLVSPAARAMRVWAVQVSKGRLYYSTWREDFDHFNPVCTRVDPVNNNEIWSVALTPGAGNGNFIPGSEVLELTMPNYNGVNHVGACGGAWSNPVADISFSPDQCCMLLAERTMAGDCKSSAHASRLLEYCRNPATNAWVPSGASFQTGTNVSNSQQSSAGGDDYDHRTSGINVRTWGTADAIKYPPDPVNADPCGPYVYGLIGFPAAGGAPSTNALMIDADQDVCGTDKFKLGDVEITCPTATQPACQANSAGDGCVNQCTIPGRICVPIVVSRECGGTYKVSRCDCIPDGQCHLQYNGPNLPPTCVQNCPGGDTCSLVATVRIDGTTDYSCGCIGDFVGCNAPISYCNPDHPGTCLSACQGGCFQAGQMCIPVEIREYPAGSGNFVITQCNCVPINGSDPACYPIVRNGHVECCGTCPTAAGGLCNVTATQEPPDALGNPGGIRYRCRCDCKYPPQNMVDWWPMNSLTPVKDRANLLNNGTPSAGVTVANPPVSCVGQGLQFNGTTGVVTVPNGILAADINFGIGPFTLEGWVQSDTGGSPFQPILDKRTQVGASVTGYAMFISGGKLGLQLASGPSQNFVANLLPSIDDGQCHHVAATVIRGSPNQIRLYVDGAFQAFTNSSVTATVTNPANLIFGQRYPIAVATAFLFGGLDEWEFFRRALTQQEIVDLYNARTLGKCCDVCYTPPVVFCRNESSRQICFQICNYCDTESNYSWNLNGPIGGPGCSITGPMTFTPSSGVTGFIPPGQCRTICVTLNLPSGMPVPPPVVTGCYQLSVTNTTTNRTFSCRNTVKRSRKWCWKCVPIWAIANMNQGTTRDFALTVTNEADPTGSINYAWHVYYPEGHAADSQAVSLNGLPPGTPVIGTLSLPQGGTTQLPISVSILESEPFQPIEIVLEADADGDGEPDPVDVITVRAGDCLVQAAGDMNEDGDTTSADIPAFVQTLRGLPPGVYSVILADTNCDGSANGRDIQGFVNALLAP